MITKVSKIAFFPKKLKAEWISFEHKVGLSPYFSCKMHNVDFPMALEKYRMIIDLKVGFVKIRAKYTESRIFEFETRASDLLDYYVAPGLLFR